MLKINSNKFNFQFFLSGNKKVENLETGAMQNGGATKFDDGVYSNIQGSEFIELKKSDNQISIFIPSTMNINNKTDNQVYINKSINYLERFYSITNNLKYYKTSGSWYSEDLKKVVIEDITIITLKLNTLTELDIQIFTDLANIIKKDMHQEGVSIAINKSLAII